MTELSTGLKDQLDSGPDAAARWSKLLDKETTYARHGDFDGLKRNLGKHSLFKQIFEQPRLGAKILLGRANMAA